MHYADSIVCLIKGAYLTSLLRMFENVRFSSFVVRCCFVLEVLTLNAQSTLRHNRHLSLALQDGFRSTPVRAMSANYHDVREQRQSTPQKSAQPILRPICHLSFVVSHSFYSFRIPHSEIRILFLTSDFRPPTSVSPRSPVPSSLRSPVPD